jgi:hypothetical protein
MTLFDPTMRGGARGRAQSARWRVCQGRTPRSFAYAPLLLTTGSRSWQIWARSFQLISSLHYTLEVLYKTWLEKSPGSKDICR